MKATINHKIIVCLISFLLLALVLSPTTVSKHFGQENTTIIEENSIQITNNVAEEKIPHHPLQRDNVVYLNIPTTNVTLNVQHTGPTSYFKSTLSDVPEGYDIKNGTYVGWCTDLDHTIQSNHPYISTVHNSYNTTLPSHLQHQNWSKANYILNHKQGSNWWQVQYALYYILDFGDQGLNADGWAMVNNATTYGTNYTPGLSDVIAVIIDAGQNIQRTIIEVAIPEYTLTIQIVGNGTVDIIPNQPTYLYGSIVNLTALPDLGWSFDNWSGDLTGNTNPNQITIDANKTVVATFTEDQYILTINIIGNGIVTKNPNQTTYTYGTTVTLTAIADIGWSFSAWSGDLTSTTNPDSIIMNADKTVNATFTQDQYILNVSINGTGNVIIDPQQTYYTYGTLVNLTASACPWWHFSHWSGDLTGSTNPTTLLMNNHKYVTAHFAIDEYTLNLTITGNGSVIKDPDLTIYTAGTLVNLTAIPDDGWQFIEWTGDVTGSTNPTYIVMDSNKSVNAHFSNEFTLTIDIEGQGTVIKDPDQTSYIFGTLVELTAIPENGWEFSHWEDDITGSINPEQILIDGNKHVTAIFIESPDTTPPIVDIISPENAVYILAQKIIPFKFPLIFLGVKVAVNASDVDSGIDRVEFYIDDELVLNDTEAPYEYNWKSSDSRKIQHKIKVVAYDNGGNSAMDELDVWRWRFHPVIIAFFLFIAAVIYRFGG